MLGGASNANVIFVQGTGRGLGHADIGTAGRENSSILLVSLDVIPAYANVGMPQHQHRQSADHDRKQEREHHGRRIYVTAKPYR